MPREVWCKQCGVWLYVQPEQTSTEVRARHQPNCLLLHPDIYQLNMLLEMMYEKPV